MQTHATLNIGPDHFAAWLAQWRQSCRLHFAETEATEMIGLAERLGSRMNETIRGTK